jgi:hypothetical protein
MHGTMFVHLRDYVEHEMGASGWRELLREANLGPRLYLPIKAYPDEEMMLLVHAAATATSQPVPALLQRFGEYLAPQLVAMYRHLLKPHWQTVDVLEHVGEHGPSCRSHRATRGYTLRTCTPNVSAITRSGSSTRPRDASVSSLKGSSAGWPVPTVKR